MSRVKCEEQQRKTKDSINLVTERTGLVVMSERERQLTCAAQMLTRMSEKTFHDCQDHLFSEAQINVIKVLEKSIIVNFKDSI